MGTVYSAEQEAIAIAIRLGWGDNVRLAVARALRGRRWMGDRYGARGFRRHVQWVTGYVGKGKRE
jgi:hypothetical protein